MTTDDGVLRARGRARVERNLWYNIDPKGELYASISHFYGLIIWLYWDEDKGQHHAPHIHAEYSGLEAVVSIPDGELLESDEGFPAKKLRMVQTAVWASVKGN